MRKLLCLARINGHVRWINQLPQFVKAEVEEGRDRLLRPDARRRPADRWPDRTARSIYVDPTTGAFRARPASARHQPAAGGRRIRRSTSSTTAASCTRSGKPSLRGGAKRDSDPQPRLVGNDASSLRSVGTRHASTHRRHRRPAQCRQIDPVQPAGRQAPGAGRRPARRDPRPARGRGATCSASISGSSTPPASRTRTRTRCPAACASRPKRPCARPTPRCS